MIVNKKSLYLLRLVIDLLLLNLVFIISSVWAQPLDVLLSRPYMFILLMALNIVWYFFPAVWKFYDDFNARYFAFQLVNIIRNVFVQTITAVLFIFIAKEDLFTRNFIVYYTLLLLIAVSLRTVFFKLTLKSLRGKGKNVRNLIIIGAGEIGKNFRQMIKDNPDFGYNFLGFIDDESYGEDIIGGTVQLEKTFKLRDVEEAVIALPQYASSALDDIIRVCNRNAIKTHIIPDYFKFVSKKFQISMMGNFPIISVRSEPLDEVQWRFVKRSFDIVFSVVIIVSILSWLIPLLALISKLSSGGKVFFVQDRIGAKNEKFKCYKLRTMIEAKTIPKEFIPASENDPRVTKFGKFLRKSNLDEIPQFFNVLTGEMSVVGPRPHAVPYDEKYGKIVEEIKLRHSVKPGITGWAQINGLRGDVEDEDENIRRTIKRIEYDLWYIENWTFWLDVQIILLTVWQMIKGDTKGI
ncbi:MAG: undecaprenyl-phosphate glucose phosphotransferase [Ignavibacteriaceae bacterium]|nr:undecaprenyl-phosphate glucose phosphotransferase [Ignavibacteriaceae bacterium]